jgi:hypothetical protein
MSPALRYRGPNNGLPAVAGNKRIAFTATDVFLRRRGFYIEVEGLDGHAFICGSMDRHESLCPNPRLDPSAYQTPYLHVLIGC